MAYTSVAKRKTSAVKKGYVPVAERTDPPIEEKKELPPLKTIKKPYEQTTRGLIHNTIGGLPRAAKDLLFPTRGYTEKQLREAKPTLKESALGVPKVAAEVVSNLGGLIPATDMVKGFQRTKVGKALVKGRKAVEEFGKPKTVGQAQSMRFADVITSVPMGTLKVSTTGAKLIAESKSLELIKNVLKREVPEISDEAAETFGRVLVNVDNTEDVQKVIDRTHAAIAERKRTYTPVIERTGEIKTASNVDVIKNTDPKLLNQTQKAIGENVPAVTNLSKATGSEVGPRRISNEMTPEQKEAIARETRINLGLAPELQGDIPYYPKDAVIRQIPKIDQLIADGKVRVVSRDGRDVYQVLKGDKWMNARNEDSAIKQATPPAPKPKEYNKEYEDLQTYIQIAEESLEQMPGKELMKYVSKTTGRLPEVTGKETMKSQTGSGKTVKNSEFGKKGDQKIQEILGSGSTAGKAPTIEEAQRRVDEYIKARDRIANAKRMRNVISASKKTTPDETPRTTRLEKAEGQSIEEQAYQALNNIDSPFEKEVSSLDKIIIDTSTSVKQKVGALDYLRTPDRVLRKIGLHQAADALRHGYDNYLAELPEQIDIITDWSKQVSKEGNVKIFKYLDGEQVELSEIEARVASEIQEYLADWAERLNLPADNRISKYITHIFEVGVNEKEFDEDIAKLIRDKVPGSVYDPFLEKRLGAKGYIQDTWRALDAYVKRAVRKANMDPALELLKRDSARLEESQLDYVTSLGARINLRPTKWDTLLDNSIKQLVGYRFGARPTNAISGTLRRMVYRGALGLNINSAIKNLTQGVNTFAKLGTRDTLNGYIKTLMPGSSEELEAVGILRESFIQDRTYGATKQLLQKLDKGLFVMFQLAEKINRGSAYYGAKYRGIRKGMDEIQAIEHAKKFVRDTQFVFGSIDTPVAMQGDLAKTLFQFGSFSQKQTEFLVEMAKKKEYAGIVRYILAASAVVYTVGKVFDIDGHDFNPLNYFSRFGKPPALALPMSIIKAVTRMPDKYGNTPTVKSSIKDIIYSGKTLIPAGIQGSKMYKGIKNGEGLKKTLIGGNEEKKDKSDVKLPSLPKLPKLPTLPKLPSIKQ